MPKNILIFSDGTGQAGGISVDENRSNIYKLYRATRVSPDTTIEPSEQVAFYDAGLGSSTINGGFFTTIWRYIHNFVSQGTGYGITTNIIDCYEMIIRLWRPGDRIYLFGFSRGAYTVRCIAGVLRLCGVPTRTGNEPLLYAPAVTRGIAKEAVKKVYQHTASWVASRATPRQLELLGQRDELASQFRARYGSSDANGDSNGYPYFIGVFDTVAALAHWNTFLLFIGILAALIVAISVGIWYIYPAYTGWFSSLWFRIAIVTFSALIVTGIAMAVASYRSAPTVQNHGRTAHFEWGRFRFYDRALSDNVKYGKHALSIDENRADFERVGWGDPRSTRPDTDEIGNRTFEQVWFAGNHADIGGSYPENESRLSDIALGWMIEVASAIPHPIKLDRSVLHLHPDPAGMQHDECKAGIKYLTRLLGKTWNLLHRKLPGPTTTTHDTVRQRFEAGPVLQYDRVGPYQPENVRIVDAYKPLFAKLPYSECDCATCREIRGLAPLPTAKSRFRDTVNGVKCWIAWIRTRFLSPAARDR